MAELERCGICNAAVEDLVMTFMTGIKPNRTSKCTSCGVIWGWFQFRGRSICMNISARPPAIPFSEWISDQLEALAAD